MSSPRRLLYKITLATPSDRGVSEYVVSMTESEAVRMRDLIDRSKKDGILDYGTVLEAEDPISVKDFMDILFYSYEIRSRQGPKDWRP